MTGTGNHHDRAPQRRPAARRAPALRRRSRVRLRRARPAGRAARAGRRPVAGDPLRARSRGQHRPRAAARTACARSGSTTATAASCATGRCETGRSRARPSTATRTASSPRCTTRSAARREQYGYDAAGRLVLTTYGYGETREPRVRPAIARHRGGPRGSRPGALRHRLRVRPRESADPHAGSRGAADARRARDRSGPGRGDALRQRSRARLRLRRRGPARRHRDPQRGERGDRIHGDRTHRRDESASPPGAQPRRRRLSPRPRSSTGSTPARSSPTRASASSATARARASRGTTPTTSSATRSARPAGRATSTTASTTGCSQRDPSTTATTRRASRRLEAVSPSPGPRRAASRPTGLPPRMGPLGPPRRARLRRRHAALRPLRRPDRERRRLGHDRRPRPRRGLARAASRETGPTATSTSAEMSASSATAQAEVTNHHRYGPYGVEPDLRHRAEPQHLRRQGRGWTVPCFSERGSTIPRSGGSCPAIQCSTGSISTRTRRGTPWASGIQMEPAAKPWRPASMSPRPSSRPSRSSRRLRRVQDRSRSAWRLVDSSYRELAWRMMRVRSMERSRSLLSGFRQQGVTSNWAHRPRSSFFAPTRATRSALHRPFQTSHGLHRERAS